MRIETSIKWFNEFVFCRETRTGGSEVSKWKSLNRKSIKIETLLSGSLINENLKSVALYLHQHSTMKTSFSRFSRFFKIIIILRFKSDFRNWQQRLLTIQYIWPRFSTRGRNSMITSLKIIIIIISQNYHWIKHTSDWCVAAPAHSK